jgi:dienelactone hydrolase
MRRGYRMAAVLLAMAAVAAGCGSDSAPTTSSTPAYQSHGPHPVGVTTLDIGSAGSLGERLATVFYPADPTTVTGHAKFSYSEASTLPTALQPILPAAYNTTTTFDAYADAPGSSSGPFPVVLFSHGFGGERLYYSNLLAGIASWGYVVVSADYLERGLAAQALGLKTTPTAAFDQSVMLSSLVATEQAADGAGTVLHGIVDPSKVAAVGHSAGGGTAFNALDDPRVATAIGWAPVAPVGAPSKKPVMLIGAEGDVAVLPRTVAHEFAAFPGPRSLVEISGEGHNTYTDICVGIRQGGGLISYAVSHHLVSASLARLGINGCQAKDLAPPRFWPIVQYYTVFQLKAVFSHGRTTVPVPAENTFPGFNVQVTQQG